ncbi:MAG: proprotein convertase P-domain-containing protein [Deltaproteobacteria bacterium]|nr:proprotein convertase P-domain-containing protein [Deltaproteobacteria bacterium]
MRHQRWRSVQRASLAAILLFSPRPAAALIPGDSNLDGRVSAADFTALQRILGGELGNDSADANRDGHITGDDLDATAALLFGGPLTAATPTPTDTATPIASPSPTSTQGASPSATVTRTSTEPFATHTATLTSTPTLSRTATASATPTASLTVAPSHTPGSAAVAESVAGSAVIVANGMTAIPSVVTALVSGLQFGGAASFDDGGAAGSCPLGGSVTRTCPFGDSMLTIKLVGCRIATPSGTATIDGSVKLGTGFCPLVLPPWMATVDVTAVFRDQANNKLLTAKANFTGTVDPQLGGTCKATGANLVLNGTLETLFPSSDDVQVTFANTSVAVTVATFNAACVPVNYSLDFDGPATIATSEAGGGAAATDPPFAVTFGHFVMQQNASANPTVLSIDGDITAACYGGTVTLQTLTPLAQAVGQPCPTSGKVKVNAPGGMSRLLYLAGGMVGIDTNLDGIADETFPSCLDSLLLLCLAQPAPTVTPTVTATGTETETATATATETESPTVTPSASATSTEPPTETPTRTPTRTATATVMTSGTETVEPSATATTPTPPSKRTKTEAPSATSTAPASATASGSPTSSPSSTPTATAGESPTSSPSSTPTTTASHSPTSSPSPTPTVTATATASGTSTRTPSVTQTTTRTATPSRTPTPTPSLAPFCDTLSSPALIPDNNPTGINNSITIANQTTIADLNVRLDIDHTWVGDLKVSLTHVTTGMTVVLLDRPGVPATSGSCSGNNISCVLDDEAGRFVETQCLASAVTSPMAAIDGSVKPNNPLSAFDGQSVAGMWRLNVSDNAVDDMGSLLGWCLEVNAPAPVVTAFTCNGSDVCTVALGQPFTLSFSFFDPDGNASSWHMGRTDDNGVTVDIADGVISPASGTWSVPLLFDPFFCPGATCRTSEFDYFVIVSDAGGNPSRQTRVHVTVPGT